MQKTSILQDPSDFCPKHNALSGNAKMVQVKNANKSIY